LHKNQALIAKQNAIPDYVTLIAEKGWRRMIYRKAKNTKKKALTLICQGFT